MLTLTALAVLRGCRAAIVRTAYCCANSIQRVGRFARACAAEDLMVENCRRKQQRRGHDAGDSEARKIGGLGAKVK